MTESRPDPDKLLALVQADEPQAQRGRLKIFFGAAPGVGKTFTMLEAARAAAREGVDVVVGYVEPHARPETQALVLGLDLLPRHEVEYRGTKLLEFDLEAALARKPQLLIVDELAHTNAPGLTHEKRWQDVEQLLAAGINVYSTLNVQHLESLNDVVSRVTGVTVRETVPDSVLDSASEVELVDLSPDDLIERLREGKIYLPQQAGLAIESFFRKGNLTALRELALRRTAERVSADVRDYRQAMAVSQTWPTGERLLVCVGPSPLSSRLVRATRRMATSLHCPWIALHVESTTRPLGPLAREQLRENLQLAEQLGGQVVTLVGHDSVTEVVQYARQNNVSKIIVGKPREPWWREWLRGSFVDRMARSSGEIDLYVISGEETEAAADSLRAPAWNAKSTVSGYAWSVFVVAICTAISALLSAHVSPVNLVMVYLIGVLLVSLWQGRGPSALASVLGVAVFDFAFVPPYGSLTVHDVEYLFTFAVMLGTGLIISVLTGQVRDQAASARSREQRTAALFALSRDLAAVQLLPDIVQAIVKHTAAAFDGDVAVLLPNVPQRAAQPLVAGGTFALTDRELGVAEWVLLNRAKAGLGTGTLPGTDVLCLPLLVAADAHGVLAIRPHQPDRLQDVEQVRLLEAFAGQAAVAMERAQLSVEAERTKLDIETERLRNSLLSAVSHDLRTPLSGIAGASSTLLGNEAALDPATKRELLETIVEESERLNRLVSNLLDVTRLESGRIVLEKDWQSLEELAGCVLQRLSRQIKDHRVTTSIPANLPLVEADGVLLQQVLVNLLENAAKYSPPGSAIQLTAEAKSNELLVAVLDGGPGIPTNDSDRLFERFRRSATTGTGQQPPGTGLGLAICRAIVTLHGGRIWAENRPEGGAAFQFTLPLTPMPNVELP